MNKVVKPTDTVEVYLVLRDMLRHIISIRIALIMNLTVSGYPDYE